MNAEAKGIALIGSCIVDELVPIIAPGQLSFVDASRFVSPAELAGEEIRYSTGGMALNVAVDLAKMAGGYPVMVIGQVGCDHRAELIRRQLRENGILDAGLRADDRYETSCTQVLHIRMPDASIERIFRYALGAMGAFSAEAIDFSLLAGYQIVQFGYGLLLPQFDLADEEYGTKMGRCLAQAQKMGLRTALDFVTPTQENLWKFYRYRPSLRFLDICCINEDQACALTEEPIPAQACTALGKRFHAKVAVVHCGAQGPNYAWSEETGLLTQANFSVRENEYKGNTGAGDAFSAGVLHGLHQGWPLQRCLAYAAASAAISLADVSATGAMRPEREILQYMADTPLAR